MRKYDTLEIILLTWLVEWLEEWASRDEAEWRDPPWSPPTDADSGQLLKFPVEQRDLLIGCRESTSITSGSIASSSRSFGSRSMQLTRTSGPRCSTWRKSEGPEMRRELSDFRAFADEENIVADRAWQSKLTRKNNTIWTHKKPEKPSHWVNGLLLISKVHQSKQVVPSQKPIFRTRYSANYSRQFETLFKTLTRMHYQKLWLKKSQ